MERCRLQTFAVVADEGHVTRAVERQHISQPAVSARIKALEEEFDLRLFERARGRCTHLGQGAAAHDLVVRVRRGARRDRCRATSAVGTRTMDDLHLHLS